MKPLSNRSYLSLLTVGDQTWDPSICNSMWPLSRLVLLTTSGSIQSICTVQERRILHPDELLALPSGHEWFCQKVYCNSYGPGRSTLRSLNGLASRLTLILLKTATLQMGETENLVGCQILISCTVLHIINISNLSIWSSCALYHVLIFLHFFGFRLPVSWSSCVSSGLILCPMVSWWVQ